MRLLKIGAMQQQSRIASIDIDLQIYLASLTTPLSAPQIALLNTFVTDLKTGLGITRLYESFDDMLILANETIESGLHNLVKRSHDATLSATAPAFTALEGFTGNGSSAYLELNYNPRTDADNYEIDSASYGIYVRYVDTTTNNYNGVYSTIADGGVANSILIGDLIGTSGAWAINSNHSSKGVSESNCFRMLIRNNSTGYDFYENKVKDNIVRASENTPNQGIVSLARRTTNGTVGLFNTMQQSMIFVGKGFTEAQQNVIYDTFQAYMTANGKQV